MKRFLPFFIIAFVGLVTVGVAAFVYRTKTQPAPASAWRKQLRLNNRKIHPSMCAVPATRR